MDGMHVLCTHQSYRLFRRLQATFFQFFNCKPPRWQLMTIIEYFNKNQSNNGMITTAAVCQICSDTYWGHQWVHPLTPSQWVLGTSGPSVEKFQMYTGISIRGFPIPTSTVWTFLTVCQDRLIKPSLGIGVRVGNEWQYYIDLNWRQGISVTIF